MAISNTIVAINTAVNALLTLLNVGGAGSIKLRTGADAIISTNPYSATAYAAAVNRVATANAITDDTNAVGGLAAIATNEDGNNLEVFRGTVTGTGGGGDVEISNTTVNAGDTVQFTAATYTGPA